MRGYPVKIEKQCPTCFGTGMITVFSMDPCDPIPVDRRECAKCQGTGRRLVTVTPEEAADQLNLFGGEK
jgi:DnaJ-class molecular chaperone